MCWGMFITPLFLSLSLSLSLCLLGSPRSRTPMKHFRRRTPAFPLLRQSDFFPARPFWAFKFFFFSLVVFSLSILLFCVWKRRFGRRKTGGRWVFVCSSNSLVVVFADSTFCFCFVLEKRNGRFCVLDSTPGS